MSNHLLIAGTGRAGTSFLVLYLHELKLETHLSRTGAAYWNEEANAGFEDTFVPGQDAPPYVAKSPWLYEMIDEVLARPDVIIDGVILPVRDLDEAAASRVIVERQNIHKVAPWMTQLSATWSTWAGAPGGVHFSLNALDQARILATGFFRLVERLTKADIPIAILSFPRLVEDGEYLFRRLQPLLPPTITADMALSAHARVADVSKVRVRKAAAADGEGSEAEIAALRRELISVRQKEARANEQLVASGQREAAIATEQARQLADVGAVSEAAIAALRRELIASGQREAIANEQATQLAERLRSTKAELAAKRAAAKAEKRKGVGPLRDLPRRLRRRLQRLWQPAAKPNPKKKGRP